jgi:hypothetical protein
MSANSSSQGDSAQAPTSYIEFLDSPQISVYRPPPGALLIGDNHLVKGSVAIIGGPPGVGKSRATVALAEAGATGFEWFGLTTHRHFRTSIIQAENGLLRLQDEFKNLDPRIGDCVRITPPPPFGLCFWKPEFCDQLKWHIASFDPDLIIIDPWSAVVYDQGIRDFLQGLHWIRNVIPPGDTSPAIIIVAHTRKPQPGDRANGRALLYTLAGSYVIGSVARCVWILQSASEAVDEKRVVVTCCKNNDGELGGRSVWERDNGLWSEATGFDWDAWDDTANDHKNGSNNQSPIDETAMEAVFSGGLHLSCADAVAALMQLTGKGRSTCYNALKLQGKFKANLRYRKSDQTFWWNL